MTDPSTQSCCFLLESSPSPIYQRITAGYKHALENRGHRVLYFEPGQYLDFDDALKHLLDILAFQTVDYFLVFDNSPLSTFYLQASNGFVFEKNEAILIFIHHDNIWSHLASTEGEPGSNLLEGWHRVEQRSIHFCLEYSNYIDLRTLGFNWVHPISHGSEFQRKDASAYQHDVLFVGHVLPGIQDVFDRFESLPFSHLVAADFWARLAALDKPIAPSAIAYASQYGSVGSPAFIQPRSLYHYVINLLSPCFRGELIKRLNPQFDIHIIGGDPGYISGSPRDRRIEQPNITYYPPTGNAQATREAYASSKINLNITSIQFDDAVVNRVIDVGAVGGFILTDRRSDLSQITIVSQEISYGSMNELNHKIDYYLTHEKERIEVSDQLHQDVISRCTYDRLVEFIFSKLNSMEKLDAEAICVDLGCGTRKPEGFIGVDTFPAPNVDIVADLNRSFPFPDSSVDYVRAYDVVEHLENRIHTMNEIWRICKPGAFVDIRVPSTDGRGAFQDPTHVSFWNLNSFKYYAIEFPTYLDLCQRYGFQGWFSIVKLGHEPETPDGVVYVGAVLKAVKSDDFLNQDFTERFNLNSLNLILFPDWSQSGEALYQELGAVLHVLGTHPQRQKMTLLVDRGNFPETTESSLEAILYDLALNLLLTNGIDIASDGPAISLVENLSWHEYKLLIQQISGRIPLSQENQEILTAFGIEDLPVCSLETLKKGELLVDELA